LLLFLRRRNGETNKTNAELRRDISRNEALGRRGAWAVVFGLGTEVVLAIAFTSGKTFAESWGLVIANSLIGLGVYAEIHFGRKALEDGSELQRLSDEKVFSAEERAAEANLLAAEASQKTETEKIERLKLELELHKTAQRVAESQLAGAITGLHSAIANQQTLSTIQVTQLQLGMLKSESMIESARAFLIMPKISSFPGTRFDAVATSLDVAAMTLLISLRHALKAAGWIEVDWLGAVDKQQSTGGIFCLVTINVDLGEEPQLLDIARILGSALNAEGIDARINEKIETATTGVIHILVSPKP